MLEEKIQAVADALKAFMQSEPIRQIVEAVKRVMSKVISKLHKRKPPLPRPRKPQTVPRQEIREKSGKFRFLSGFT